MTKPTGTTRDCKRCRGTGSVQCLRVDFGRCFNCGGTGAESWVSAETRRERLETSREVTMARLKQEGEAVKVRVEELSTKPHRKHALDRTLVELKELRERWLVLANRQCPVHDAPVTRGVWEQTK